MIGPKQLGFWSSQARPRFEHLHTGERYKVVREFKDFDGDLHRSGEEWIFLGSNFLPYENGLSLFVSPDGIEEWHIRLQGRPEEQSHVISSITDYLEFLG